MIGGVSDSRLTPLAFLERTAPAFPGRTAVVAIPDEEWSERPKGFVTLRDGATLTVEELIAFLRETLPGFKAPTEIEFGELPKTSTGKVKKYELRERERQGRSAR